MTTDRDASPVLAGASRSRLWCRLRGHWRLGERSSHREPDVEVEPGLTQIGRWICNWCGRPMPRRCDECGRDL